MRFACQPNGQLVSLPNKTGGPTEQRWSARRSGWGALARSRDTEHSIALAICCCCTSTLMARLGEGQGTLHWRARLQENVPAGGLALGRQAAGAAGRGNESSVSTPHACRWAYCNTHMPPSRRHIDETRVVRRRQCRCHGNRGEPTIYSVAHRRRRSTHASRYLSSRAERPPVVHPAVALIFMHVLVGSAMIRQHLRVQRSLDQAHDGARITRRLDSSRDRTNPRVRVSPRAPTRTPAWSAPCA